MVVVPSCATEVGFLGPDAKAVITVLDEKCEIDKELLQCNNKGCTAGKKIHWKVKNESSNAAVVILLNFRIKKPKNTGVYWSLDPLHKPGIGTGAEHFVKVNAGGTDTLKTKVRKFKYGFFKGTYEYDIAISFDEKNDKEKAFAICADPAIDIYY